jgi:hypothetical protein
MNEHTTQSPPEFERVAQARPDEIVLEIIVDPQRRFFEQLFWDATGYLCLATKTPRFREEFFAYPDELGDALEWLHEQYRHQRDAYFSPMLFSERKRSKETVRVAPAVYADVDTCARSTIDPEPTIAIATSPGRFQGLWLLKGVVDPRLVEDASKRLAYAHEGADRNGWDLTQLLRVPQSLNAKPERRLTEGSMPAVEEVSRTDHRFTLADFSHFPTIATSPDAHDALMPSDVGTREQAVAILERYRDLPHDAREHFFRAPAEDWSRALCRLERSLLEQQPRPSRQDVFRVCYHAASNKFLRDGRRLADLWEDVLRAEARAAEVVVAESATGPLVLRRASSIRPEPVTWAWHQRIPLRCLTLVVGPPGKNKSTFVLERAARATRGELEGDLYGAPVNCVIASAEDSAKHTLVPRLMAARADLERVFFVEMEGGDVSLPRDIEKLEHEVTAIDARIVVLDPVNAYLDAGVDSHRDESMRRALAPLAAFAERGDRAIVGVAHLNKRESTDLVSRVGASIANTAAPRSVLLVGSDPNQSAEDGPQRVVVHGKSNLSAHAPTLRFDAEQCFVASIETVRIAWPGEVATSASEVLDTMTDKGAVAEAEDFLTQELAAGPIDVPTLLAGAMKLGIAEKTLRRAKANLRVEAQKLGMRKGWVWVLPAQDDQDGH